jgi:glycosyltransferase involved in cell wall biosynthesis
MSIRQTFHKNTKTTLAVQQLAQPQSVSLRTLLSQEHSDFLQHVYVLLLEREPDVESIQNYMSALNAGAPKLQVLYDIISRHQACKNKHAFQRVTSEIKHHQRVQFRKKTSAYLYTYTLQQLLALPDEQLFLKHAYLSILGRLPDTDGQTNYTALLQLGTSRFEIIRQLRCSAEGRYRPAGLPNLDLHMEANKFYKRIKSLMRKYRKPQISSLNEPSTYPALDITAPPYIDPQRERVLKTKLFDGAWYLRRYPGVASTLSDAFDHYLAKGGIEGRWPSPYFHGDYYLRQNIDVCQAGINPLVHYIEHGEAEGRKPNPYFDPNWYTQCYGAAPESGNIALSHFVVYGGLTTNPSTLFDAKQYYADAPDVRKNLLNPLAHYIDHGQVEGRRIVPTSHFTRAASATIAIYKRANTNYQRAAIFVTHSESGLLRGDVINYLAALNKNSVSIILVIASDQARNYVPVAISALCTAVVIRENIGFDFAAWSHTLQIIPELLNAQSLYLLNDSVVGPLCERDFTLLLQSLEARDADIVGLTENEFQCPHLQTYFLRLNSRVLSSVYFAKYVLEIVNLGTKEQVINLYEIPFTSRMKSGGFTCEALATNRLARSDLTIFHWQELIALGIPFVKRSLLTGEHRAKGGSAVILEIAQKAPGVKTALGTLIPSNLDNRRSFDTLLCGRSREINTSAERSTQQNAASKYGHRASTDLLNINTTYIGAPNFSNGLGEASRGYISALMRTGLPYNIRPVQRPFGAHTQRAPSWIVNQNAAPPDIAIIHINPDGWNGLLTPDDKKVINSARRRVGLFVWETTALRADWISAIGSMDALIVPSNFCATIFRKYTTTPVYVLPHSVECSSIAIGHSVLKNKLRSIKKRYRIPDKSRVILYVFDSSSFVTRKNPAALIRAFIAASIGNEGWHLVLKTKLLKTQHQDNAELRNLMLGHHSITLIDEALNKDDLQALFSAAEIYASPHCSEGFGLTIAEAMAQGKIVVATDYGGCRDFLNASTGIPVRADVVTLGKDVGPYHGDSEWAVIDETALANALVRAAEVCDSAEMHRAFVTNARVLVQKMMSRATIAEKMLTILQNVHVDTEHSNSARNLQL